MITSYLTLFLVSWFICGMSVAVVDCITYVLGWDSPHNTYHPHCDHFFCPWIIHINAFILTVVFGYISLYYAIKDFIRSFWLKPIPDMSISAMYPNMTRPFNNKTKDDKYDS